MIITILAVIIFIIAAIHLFYKYIKRRISARKLNKDFFESGKYDGIKNAIVGDIVKIGEYKPQNEIQPIEWIVLKKINGRITLISKNVLTEHLYDRGDYHVDWMSCDLRQYMNNKINTSDDFFSFLETEEAANKGFVLDFFSPEERFLPSKDSCVKGSSDTILCPSTEDAFYILSRDEIEKYMEIPAFKDSCMNESVDNCCNAFWVRSKEANKYMIYSIKDKMFVEQDKCNAVFGIRAVFEIYIDGAQFKA